MSGGETPNLVLKRMLDLFQKFPPLNKRLEFQNQEKGYEICTERNFEPKIKLIIENVQNELYQ